MEFCYLLSHFDLGYLLYDIMSISRQVTNSIRTVLTDRSFSDIQIEKIIPRLHNQHLRQPSLLGEIIDCWNDLFSHSGGSKDFEKSDKNYIPKLASPPNKSAPSNQSIDMTTILAEIEPDLLLFDPDKLRQRHDNILGLGLIHNMAEQWLVLSKAPRGFYLQDWFELTRKIFYVDAKVLDLLYDKKEKRELETHPIIKNAAVTESDFDHIRTRYLFAHRTGYNSLSFMRSIQTANTRPNLQDFILSSDDSYLRRFAPYCSLEEFSSFSDLIKNHELDEDDADIFNRLAELNLTRHQTTKTQKVDSIYDDDLSV